MGEALRDPIVYPNWVWIAGFGLVLAALVWGTGILLAYRHSTVARHAPLRPLTEIRRQRYGRLLEEIREKRESNSLSARQTYLALNALIRAAASERLGADVESCSVQMVREKYSQWPLLVEALAWTERPSFGTAPDDEPRSVEIGFDYAWQVIEQ